MKNTRSAWIGLVGLAAIVAVLALIRFWDRDGEPSPTTALGLQTAMKAIVAEGPTNEVGDDPDREPSERIARVTPAFSGEVTDERDLPLEGVHVSLTPLESVSVSKRLSWRDSSRLELIKGSARTRTSESGRFSFWSVSSGALGTVLWLTCPGYESKSFVLDKDIAEWEVNAAYVLKPSRVVEVLVTDEESRPVPGCAVEMHGSLFENLGQSPSERLQLASQRALFVREETNESGTCSMPFVAGDVALIASTASQRSKPWHGELDEHVTLVLRPTFLAFGSIDADRRTIDAAHLKVEVRIPEDDHYLTIQETLAEADGGWQLEAIPILQVPDYRFRLVGDGVVTKEVVIDLPHPGQEVHIKFVTEPGIPLSVHVVDQDNENIENATVVFFWQGEEDWKTAVELTAADGLVTNSSCPPGEVWIQAHSEGYVAQEDGPFVIEHEDYGVIRFTLEGAGVIRGQCTHQGDPVTSFDVLVWKGPPFPQAKKHFESEDGRFEFAEAPTGDVMVMAQTQGYPPSQVVSVAVDSKIGATVDLTIPSPLTGIGRIIDFESEEPISGAVVRLYMGTGGVGFGEYGGLFLSDADGLVEVDQLDPQMTSLTVEAPGYITHSGYVAARTKDHVELGVIRLVRARPLTVVLHSDHIENFSQFEVTLNGTVFNRKLPCPADGVVVFEESPLGRFQILVSHPRYGDRFVLTDLTLLDEWIIDVSIPAGPTVNVQLTNHDTLRDYQVGASFITAVGEKVEIVRVLGVDGTTTIEGIDAESVALTLESKKPFVPIESRMVHFQGSQTEDVIFDLDRSRAKDLQILVVDRKGDPIPLVEVVLSLPGNSAWILNESTASNGIVSFGRIEMEDLLVTLRHAVLGTVTGLALSNPGHGRPLKVVFNADRDVKLQLRDGSDLCEGVTTWAVGLDSNAPIGRHTSDSSGLLTLPRLSGRVRIRVTHPEYWPSTFDVEAQAGDPIPVQVRRRGNVAIEVRDSGNRPVPNASVELRSLEFDTEVGQWVQEELIPAPPAGFLTDASGRLQLSGLPNGAYEWTVTGPNGMASGEVTIPPAGNVVVVAKVP